MKKNTFLTICLSLFLVGGLFSQQTTVYVSALGDGTKDGTTEANAYPQTNFNTALADVSAGDKLIIIGTVKTIGANLTSKSYAFTIEGLDASSTLANVNGGTGRLFTINGPTAADVTFKNLTFSGYNTTLAGGGVFYNNNAGATATFENCTFTGNSVTNNQGGGAIFFANGTLNIIDSSFENNTSSDEGGAIFANSGTITITNTLFKTNSAASKGGAIYTTNGDFTITGSTFYDNETTGAGGGSAFYVASSGSTNSITNCTFFENTTANDNQDYGTIRTDNGNTIVTNSLFYDNKTNNDTGAPSDWGSGPNGTQTFNTSIAQWISTNVDNQDEGTGSITGIKNGGGTPANLTSSNLFFDASDGFVKYTAAPSGDDSPIDFGSDGNDVGAWDYVDNPADTTAPVITVIGDDPATVELGAAYTDAGATASDNIDGDITNTIITVNNVNTNIVASYTVTYNVSDASGNAATEVTRTVNVVDTFAPNTYFVKVGGNNNGGLSEENAFTTVNNAVVAASDGDTITIVGAINQSGQVGIGKSISFVGQSDATITGTGATNRLYNISEAGKTISFTDVIFKDNTGATANGSVFNTTQGGTLAFTNCVFSGNSSVSTGGGGAIYVNNASAVLTITGCTFYNNSSGNATNNGQGGAIMLFNSSASSTITNSTFFDNKITRSDGNFGASVRVNNGGKVTISNSLSYNNKADSGAGAGSGFNASPDATLNVLNSIVDFTNNTDTSTGSNLTADLSSSNLFFDASDGFVKYTAAPSGDDSPIDFGSDGEDVGAWDYVSTGVDADGDGFNSDVDCNDNDASVNAIATWYIGVDTDSDGFIGSVTDTQSCSSPGTGYALTAPAITDCNDGDADINPGATEVFDGVDNNCDGNVDEVFTNAAIWNGAINSDWTNVGNWDTNAPGLSPIDDVTIPSGLTNYPVLTSGQDLSLANGLSLTIASGASLSISPTVVITNNGTVIVDGSMTLQSDATGSAYIGSGSGTFTGDVTVERYISARRAYRQLSTPVTTSNFISNNWQQGTHITGSTAGANGFDATGSGNPSMYTFDNVAYNYVPMANTDATNLLTGQGYHMLVRGDRTTDLTNNNATPSETTLSATGTLVSENAGTSTVNVTVPEQRFVFVGNPFQAPVDMNKVITTDATNINSTYYWVWDPTLGTRGAYAAVFAATGSTAVSDANQYLQAGQAGWVYTAAPGATQLSFTQASKNTSVSETAVFKTTAKKASTGELRLSLYETSALAANQSAVDGILVLFDDAGNNAVDGSDAPKFTNLDETFSTSNNGTLLAIESRATPVDTDEITLSITTYRDNNYTIVAEGTAVQGEAPYLFDAYADVYTEIPQNGTVNYAYSIDDNIPASMDAERFTVVFGQQALTVSNLDIERIMLYPNPSNTGQFYLNIPQQMDDLEVTIYNALGAKLFYKTGFTAGQNVSIKTSFTRDQGLYFVNLTSKGVTTTKKLIIN